MIVSYENINFEDFNVQLDQTYPTLCIDKEEIRKTNKKELNSIIEIYIQGIDALQVVTDDDSFLSNQLYLAIKLWLTRENGRYLICSRIMNDIINLYTNEPIRVIEICYQNYETNDISPIYYLENINVIKSDNEEDELMYINPNNFSCSYSILSPIISMD